MKVDLSKYSDKVVVIHTDDGKEINIYVDGRDIQVRTHAGDFKSVEHVPFGYDET